MTRAVTPRALAGHCFTSRLINVVRGGSVTEVDWPSILAAVQMASGQLDEDERLERARALIDASFAEPLSVETLAKAACLSREHFIRAFRRAYGLTPHQYVIRRRIQGARTLLERTDLTVTEVCLEVGFSSLGSFSTLFASQVGHPPNRYRKKSVISLGISQLPIVPSCFALRFGTSSLFEKRRLDLGR